MSRIWNEKKRDISGDKDIRDILLYVEWHVKREEIFRHAIMLVNCKFRVACDFIFLMRLSLCVEGLYDFTLRASNLKISDAFSA